MLLRLYIGYFDINISYLKCENNVIQNMVKQINYKNIKQHLNKKSISKSI